MKIHIKYMVSLRCKMAVESVLESMELKFRTLDLGEVDLYDSISEEQFNEIRDLLIPFGLLLLEDSKSVLIEKIKNAIIERIHYGKEEEEEDDESFPNYLSQQLGYDYTYLSNLFSKVCGSTIEHFIISHKVERVKELLLYDELNLTEIAYRMHYSSVAHLSNQFKKVTGLSPSYYKTIKQFKTRINLEEVM